MSVVLFDSSLKGMSYLRVYGRGDKTVLNLLELRRLEVLSHNLSVKNINKNA